MTHVVTLATLGDKSEAATDKKLSEFLLCNVVNKD